MRINEILIESQLNEEILTELDWSKIKKGLATGAITLGALGISGNAMAQHFKVDNASKIKDSQVVKYVQDKVDTGEIKPAVVKQAVQKVDTAPEVKPEPKQDVKPEVKKTEPKVDAKPEVKKIDEPKKTASDELDTVKKNAGIEKTQSGKLSSFSIKGLQFGMSLEQVVGITKAQENDKDAYDAYYAADRAARSKDVDWYKQPSKSSSDYKKPVGSWDKALDGFTIAGYSGWNTLTSDGPSWKTDSKSSTLEGMYKTISPEDFEDIVSKFTKQYGKPNIGQSGVRNKMNYSDVNITATWKVKDATITIDKYNGKFTEGIVWIESDKYTANEAARSKSKKDKDSKDF